MARKPDTPCAECGKLLWTGAGSKPAGERKCRACRTALGEPTNPRVNTDGLIAGARKPVRESKAARPHRVGRPWRRLREQVLAEETHCFRCGEEVDKTLRSGRRWSASVDHVVDVADGGVPLARDNVRLSHHGCNAAAGNAKRTGQAGTAGVTEADKERGFAQRGRRLWRELAGDNLEPGRQFLLEEICRVADRLDRLDSVLRGESDDWVRLDLGEDGQPAVSIARALAEARQQAVALTRLMAELRQAGKATAGAPKAGGDPVDEIGKRRQARRAGTAGQ